MLVRSSMTKLRPLAGSPLKAVNLSSCPLSLKTAPRNRSGSDISEHVGNIDSFLSIGRHKGCRDPISHVDREENGSIVITCPASLFRSFSRMPRRCSAYDHIHAQAAHLDDGRFPECRLAACRGHGWPSILLRIRAEIHRNIRPLQFENASMRRALRKHDRIVASRAETIRARFQPKQTRQPASSA